MARVLVVTNTPHSPATSGYSQRVTAVIAALESAGHTVRAMAIKPLTGGYPNSRVAPYAQAAVLARLFRNFSFSQFKWYSPKACDALAKISRKWKPQAVVLESSYLAPYRILFKCPVIFDLHNIESQLIENYANDRRGLVAAAARFESKLLERVEASIPAASSGVATVSDKDRDTLSRVSAAVHPTGAPHRAATSSPQVVAAPNGVNDEAFFVGDNLAAAEGPTAVFIGHLGWRPNIDGAKWIATEVWPLVRREVPRAQLQLIGRDPSPLVQELANPAAGISVHGNVESVFPYLAEAAVATAPLWTAGGTRLKILEALGTGTPVVATSLGALGLEHLAGPQVLTICDQPAAFAAALAEHLNHPAKSAAARNAAEAYRWSNTLTSLVNGE